MGHIHPDCKKNIPQDCWFIGRAFQADQDIAQDIAQDAPPAHITTHSDNALTGSWRSQRSSTPALNCRSDADDDLSWQGLQFFNILDEPQKPKFLYGFSQAPPAGRLSDVNK